MEFLLITKFKERYHPISNKNIHVWKITFYKRKMKMIGKSTQRKDRGKSLGDQHIETSDVNSL